MLVTNMFDVPRPFLEAINKMSWKPNPNKIYATSLAAPPMIRHLTQKYWDEMEVDASDYFYRLFGSAMHHVLEDASKDLTDVQIERSVSIPAERFGIEISGRIDWIEGMPVRLIGEAKTAGVMSIARGVKDDWIFQANVYRLALKYIDNIEVPKLKAFVLLRDWIPSKLRDDGYPRTPFAELDIPVWPFEKTEAWVQERVNLHLAKDVPMCTDEEKWQNPDCFAIMRRGVAKAVAATLVVDGERRPIASWEEAEWIIGEKGLKKDHQAGKIYVEKRTGEPRRCQYYCDCRSICARVNGTKI
jgi:hypothetical protein